MIPIRFRQNSYRYFVKLYSKISIFNFIDREEQEVEAEYSKLKSSICCPPNILNVLLAQTEMTEGQIHVEYMKFKNEYPTGM